MNRREMLITSGAAALTLSAFPLGWTAAADAPKRRILMFTRSQGYEHEVIKHGKDNKLSLAENIVTELGEKHGFDVHCTKEPVPVLVEPVERLIKRMKGQQKE